MKKVLIIIFLSLIVSACQKASNAVIDNSRFINPQLGYFSGDSVDIASYINNDSSQLVLTDSFRVSVDYPQGFSYLTVNVQNDSGNTIASDRYKTIVDSTVSGTITVAPPSVYVGNLTYTFTPYNQIAEPGNSVSTILKLYNSKNLPPVIDSVSAPDSLQIDSTHAILFYLYATANDPNGLNDIKHVYFDTFKPDGKASTGNPFYMYDDGGASGNPADGDSVANDGIYTLIVQLPALDAPTPPALGKYVFKFYAEDRSGAVSQPVSHDIEVYK